MYTLGCRFVSRWSTGGQSHLRSAHEMFYQFSRPFGCGAFRFLFWWLFLHLWLRPSNVGPTFAEPFAPFSGSCLKGATRFYPNGLRKPRSSLQQSLSASTQGVNRINSRLSFPSSVCHHIGCRSLCWSRRPWPSRRGELYANAFLRSIFYVFYFLRSWKKHLRLQIRIRSEVFIGVFAVQQSRLELSFARWKALLRFGTCFAARKNLSSHLFCGAARYARANAAHFG